MIRPVRTIGLSFALACSVAACEEDSEDDFASIEYASPADEVRIEQILEDITTVMYDCPEQVWSERAAERWRRAQVLLVSLEDDVGVLWNDQSREGDDAPAVIRGDLDTVPDVWLASSYELNTLSGVPTIGVSLDESFLTGEATDDAPMERRELYVDGASRLIFHEGFHYLGQAGWQRGGGSRSYPYPEPWEPRYVRAELIRSLRAALDGAPLEAAAYWHARALEDFPDEMDLIRSFDVTEGTAQFVELWSSALSRVGCDAEDELTREAKAHIDTFLGTPDFRGGGEPYDLGMLAGLMLRERGVDDWEEAAEGGVPPVEVLLADIDPEPQDEDREFRDAARTAVEQRNEALAAEIEPMLEDLHSEEAVRVVVDFSWSLGSFQLGGFYYLPDVEGEPDVLLKLSMSMSPPFGPDFHLREETSIVGGPTPCFSIAQPVILTLAAQDVDVEDGLATSRAPTAAFEGLPVVVVEDDDGLDWICAETG